MKITLENKKQSTQNDELANIVAQIQQEGVVQRPPIPTGDPATDPQEPYVEPDSAFTEITNPETGETMRVLKEYAPIFLKNTDFVGWIQIPGTRLSYPVMQTSTDNPNYYLKLDFYEQTSRHGTIYANEWCDVNTPSDNITIFGHNMSDGSMFAPLHDYRQKSFYEANPYIYFDTLYAHHTYQIVAVFDTTDLADTGFSYHTFVNGNTITFDDYIATCKALSLYDTGVSASYGDKLITLSTCDSNYWDDHGRYVVVAKRVA